MVSAGGYDIDLVALLMWAAALAALLLLLPRVSYHIFRRPLVGSEGSHALGASAAALQARSLKLWKARGNLVSQWSSFTIGGACVLLGLLILGLNLTILARVFDFLWGGGLNTFEPRLPLIGAVGEEVDIIAFISALIFAAVECALGVLLFYLWHGPLRLLPSGNQKAAGDSRASRFLTVVVGALLIGAAAFESTMNCLQVGTLQIDASLIAIVGAAFMRGSNT